MIGYNAVTMNMSPESIIACQTGAKQVRELETLQELWSGYGSIKRFAVLGAEEQTVIVKHVSPPDDVTHPRGWNTSTSHQRKLRSYQVETAWYDHFAAQCTAACRVPACLGVERSGEEVVMVLEDLDGAGFSARRGSVGEADVVSCIRWLAHFHARFLGVATDGLWPVGTYWHLDTRPDEWAELPPGVLKDAAAAIDTRLNTCRYLTLVHGDAKLANFCFRPDGSDVAAVDFQYVGGGCGMKDLAYFIGSCFHEEDCESRETALLDLYFDALRSALGDRADAAAVEAEWRPLYPVAWTDFYRFLQGWSPGHWKLHRYSERLARKVLAEMGAA